MTSNNHSPRIVIIGANFAGLSAASKLANNLNVIVIDSKTHFQWTPNIHEILSDVKKADGVRICLHTVFDKLGHTFINGEVSKLSPSSQTITLNDGCKLQYDILLIASGHTRENYGVLGATEYAFGFRSSEEVETIKTRLLALLSESDKPVHLNIVGAGYTGIEVAGEILRKYPNNEQLKINVIDRSQRLLPLLPEKLASDIQMELNAHKVNLLLEHDIQQIAQESIYFADKTLLPSDITIWTAGTSLPEYLKNTSLSSTHNGIIVKSTLQTPEYENIFVAGDAASLDQPMAKQASIAMDMGEHAAININALCTGLSLTEVRIGPKPVLFTLGDINTYFVYQDLVLASPALSAAKEAVYQLYMAKLTAMLPLEQKVSGLFSRLISTEKLILAEILKCRPREILTRSKLI